MTIITIFTYSEILSVAVLALLAATILSMCGFFLVPQVRKRILAIPYRTFLKAIGVISIISTLGALIYQFYFLTPVCVLCWWQRIFMFPIDILIIVALIYRERATHVATGILALIGSAFALKHYYGHFQIHVQKNTDYIMTCDAYGSGGPDCGATLVQTFGFVTIPLMALVAFVAIAWLSFLAHKVR